MSQYQQDPDDEDEWEEDEDQDEMDTKYPEYSEQSRNAGRFLGLDHPYVPGDPGL